MLIAMPHHPLDLIIIDTESDAESIKRFLAGIEGPLASIELTGSKPGVDLLWLLSSGQIGSRPSRFQGYQTTYGYAFWNGEDRRPVRRQGVNNFGATRSPLRV